MPKRKCGASGCAFARRGAGSRKPNSVFAAFAALHLRELDAAELVEFELLLSLPDQDVYDWLRGYAPVPALRDTEVFARLKAICARKNPAWND